MKQWREIHCDCFLSAEIKRCLSTTHRCKRLPMMHRCRDMLVLDTYCYAPLYQPYIYLQHRTKMITILSFSFFSFICIEYIIYVVFSNQQSTFIFFTLTVNGVSFKQRGENKWVFIRVIFYTQLSGLFFIVAFYLASVLSGDEFQFVKRGNRRRRRRRRDCLAAITQTWSISKLEINKSLTGSRRMRPAGLLDPASVYIHYSFKLNTITICLWCLDPDSFV